MRSVLNFLLVLVFVTAPTALCQDSRPAARKNVKTVMKEITFTSEDGLVLTADLYTAGTDTKKPFILLCHQARWSRGEYREIAPKLVAMGFHCLALDQRSGAGVNSVQNQSALAAFKKKLPTTYLDARQDIIAALKFVRKKHAKGKLLLWGSSYSSALALEIAGNHSDLMDGVLAFAPGEYFGRLGKSGDWVRKGAGKITKPVFLTGSKRETEAQVKQIADVMKLGDKLHFFKPKTAGNHGSRALFEQFPDNKAYWKAVTAFLDQFFPRKQAASQPAKK